MDISDAQLALRGSKCAKKMPLKPLHQYQSELQVGSMLPNRSCHIPAIQMSHKNIFTVG